MRGMKMCNCSYFKEVDIEIKEKDDKLLMGICQRPLDPCSVTEYIEIKVCPFCGYRLEDEVEGG